MVKDTTRILRRNFNNFQDFLSYFGIITQLITTIIIKYVIKNKIVVYLNALFMIMMTIMTIA